MGEDKAAQLLEEHGRGQQVSNVPEPPKAEPERGLIVLVVLSLFVSSVHRRCGLGRAAVEHWKLLGKELRAESIEARVPEEAADARAFFLGCGFEDVSVASQDKEVIVVSSQVGTGPESAPGRQ